MINTMEQHNICRHDELCGGCTYQGTDYEEQLRTKENAVRSLFSSAEITPAQFAPIEGCPGEQRFGYRNKMEYTFGDMVKDGPLCLGMHKIKNFMSIVTVDECQLVHPDFNRILRFTLDFCTDRGYVKYHKKSHQGLLRNLVVRRGVRTGELLVNIVTSSQSEFDEEAWKEGLLALPLDCRIVGVMRTLNDGLADTVACDELRLLYGREYYYEELLGLQFIVHEFAFFQTNVDAVERLYSEALALIPDLEGKTVFDLYCGTGTISQIAARSAARVLGVEIVPESVESARENAALNGLDNCEFVCGDVFAVLDTRQDKPDVIIVDPPRAGMSQEAVTHIASYGVEQILYISCNPKSLVKNLTWFAELGYEAGYVRPYDNFPMTRHVETCALLVRESAQDDEVVSIKVDLDGIELDQGRYVPPEKPTYKNIKQWILDKYGFKVSTLYIAQIKDKVGLEKRKNYNPGSGEGKVPICPPEKEEAIMDAFRHYHLI